MILSGVLVGGNRGSQGLCSEGNGMFSGLKLVLYIIVIKCFEF